MKSNYGQSKPFVFERKVAGHLSEMSGIVLAISSTMHSDRRAGQYRIVMT